MTNPTATAATAAAFPGGPAAPGVVAPAALNVYRKIAVIRSGGDTLQYEADGVVRTVSVQELGDAIATATPLVVPRPKLEIPVPHITINDSYYRDVPANYALPRSYVRYHRVTPDEFLDRVDYVADREDELWLQQKEFFSVAVDKSAGKDKPATQTAAVSKDPFARRPQLSLELLETMLDVLEKKTGFESIVTLQQAEQLILTKVPHLKHMFPLHVPRARTGDADAATPVTMKTVLTGVYNYWVQKRSRLKRPLLRNYWPVTSTEDTNPHLVFRPREKEKYRLRKKRQNDFDAYQKLQQLRSDFESLRAVLGQVKHREELKRTRAQLQIDLFHQRLHDVVDASGEPRLAVSSKIAVQCQLEQAAMDLQGRKNKRSRPNNNMGRGFDAASFAHSRVAPLGSGQVGVDAGQLGFAMNIAGRNLGEPAPNFLQPLPTRESYVTSWEESVPHVATYVDSHVEPTLRFRHRPRIGRGGRICIDRLPLPVDPSIEQPTVVTVGKGLPNYLETKESLLDLFPKPLNHTAVSRRIEEICLAAAKDDAERPRHATAIDQEENDGDEIVVDTKQWLGTDEQLWGEERYSISFT